MPRTKISKNTKRNRDVANREEKLREFDQAVDEYLELLDVKTKQEIADINEEIELMKSRIPQQFLKMTMGELMSMNINDFSQVKDNHPQPAARILQPNQSQNVTSAKKSKDDEGYITEDNSLSGASGVSTAVFANLSLLRSAGTRSGRTPGPLSSAKAKKSTRRSKSAGGNLVNGFGSNKPKVVASSSTTASMDRAPRLTMRTPICNDRVKALSADRSKSDRAKPPTSPTALLRWPKPGEQVVSMFGSPVVAQVLPEAYANVNIPVKNGVLSLRPKKMASVNPEIIQNIDSETLDQIKTLQSNLNLIMSYANRLDN